MQGKTEDIAEDRRITISYGRDRFIPGMLIGEYVGRTSGNKTLTQIKFRFKTNRG